MGFKAKWVQKPSRFGWSWSSRTHKERIIDFISDKMISLVDWLVILLKIRQKLQKRNSAIARSSPNTLPSPMWLRKRDLLIFVTREILSNRSVWYARWCHWLECVPGQERNSVPWQLAVVIDPPFKILGKLWTGSRVHTQFFTLYTISWAVWKGKGCGLFRHGACQERKALWPFDVEPSFLKSRRDRLQIQGSNWIKTFKVLLLYCSFKGKEVLSHSHLCIPV